MNSHTAAFEVTVHSEYLLHFYSPGQMQVSCRGPSSSPRSTPLECGTAARCLEQTTDEEKTVIGAWIAHIILVVCFRFKSYLMTFKKTHNNTITH